MGEAPPKGEKNFRIVNSPELDDGFESDMEAPAEDVLREEKARKKRERKQALEAEESRRVDKEYSDPAERSELHVRLGELNKKSDGRACDSGGAGIYNDYFSI